MSHWNYSFSQKHAVLNKISKGSILFQLYLFVKCIQAEFLVKTQERQAWAVSVVVIKVVTKIFICEIYAQIHYYLNIFPVQSRRPRKHTLFCLHPILNRQKIEHNTLHDDTERNSCSGTNWREKLKSHSVPSRMLSWFLLLFHILFTKT